MLHRLVLFCVLNLFLFSGSLLGQSSFSRSEVINSSNGYDVIISVTIYDDLENVVSHTDGSFEYQIKYDYELQFTGSNQPSNLWTFNGYVECGGLSIYLPGTSTSPGSGTSLYSSVASNSGCHSEKISCICPDFGVYFDVSGPGIGYSSHYLGTPSVLPVEYVYFNAGQSERKIELNWKTASERNSHYFEIQRSENGITWRPLGQIEAAGNSNIDRSYVWEDSNVVSTLYYYRLKQVDFDGVFEYSPVRSVEVNSVEDLVIFPNPARNTLTVYSNEQANNTALFLLNSQGKIIDELRSNLNTNQSIMVDLTGLPKGVYYISNGSKTKKFVKL